MILPSGKLLRCSDTALVIQAGFDNITFSDDQFGRRELAEQLNSLILKSELFKENESFSIAIDAAWGMGKTQFLHMWRSMMMQLESPIHSSIVYYNVWEYDDSDDALTPLTFHICEAYQKRKEKEDQDISFIQRIMQLSVQATLYMSAAAFPVASVIKDIGIMAIEKMTEKRAISAFEIHRASLRAKEEFRNAIRSMAGDKKLIIMIDELDRCHPLFALKTLEAIKHYFNTPNVVFVFALDMYQLSKSIAAVYGQDMDALGYLNRFFDHKTKMNLPTAVQYLRCLPDQTYPDDNESLGVLEETVDVFSLSARQTIKLLRMFNVFKITVEQGPQAVYAYRFYFVLLALKDNEPKLYNEIIKGDRMALEHSDMFKKARKIKDYLLFLLEQAPIPCSLVEISLDKITRPKRQKEQSGKAQTGTRDHVRLSLAKYFIHNKLVNYPEERLFGSILQERMEVFSVPMREQISS